MLPDDEMAKARKLIAQLGHADYEQREAAQKALPAYGRSIVEELRKACKSDDAEVRARAGIVMKAILAANRELHVVGLYEGFGAVHGHGRERQPGTAKVRVRRKGKNVVLVLCAYEPVKWSVEIEKGVMLAKVILSGYYTQTVEGLPEGTEVVNGSWKEGGDSACFMAYEAQGEDYDDLVKAVRQITELDITSFQGIYRPKRGQVFTVTADGEASEAADENGEQ
jgi:hypothetical protein